LEDLKQIINDCAAGKLKAQEQLYRMLAPKMFGVCLRYAKDSTEAEDNLQDGFIKVFQHIKKFRHEGSLEGWVRRIMVNVSLEKFRKQNILHPVEDISSFEGQTSNDTIIENISAQEIIELIQQLPPRYRMVFNLYVMEGMNHREISQEMEITEGTSKSNLARAREILKRRVTTLYGDTKNSNSTA
jgi:RNA polymerase sigma-70 factor (ECF subfamily)